MLYTILIFRDFIFKENALFTYFIVLFLYKTVKTAESILNSDDMVYPFLIFRLFVFVLPKCGFCVFCIVLCTEHNSCNINYFRHCGLPTMPRPPTKYPTNIPQNVHIQPRNTPHFIPQGVGVDSSRPHFHIIKYAYSFPRTRMSTLSNTYIHSTTHAYPFLILRLFTYLQTP